MNLKNDILKSNVILGAAQAVQMLVTIIRAKLIAVFLGSAGIAINAILQSLLQMIYNITSCGLMQSGVLELSRASYDINRTKCSPEFIDKYAIFKKLVYFAGVISMMTCFIIAYPACLTSFGNNDNILSFFLLGVGAIFFMLMHGEMTILQSTRSLKLLAKSSIIGSILSLVVGIPCYYFLGISGIAVSITLGYAVFWSTYRLNRKKLNIPYNAISLKQALRQGKPMLELGAVLMTGTFLVSGFTYLTNISIRALGNLEDVGFYQGVSAIASQSIVIIISVLASDFFPRLSAIADNFEEKNSLINQQLNVVLSVIPMIATVIICFPSVIIRILLTEEFLKVAPLLQLLAISLIFRGIWITMSYIILAHRDRKRYFIFDALIGNGLTFIINILAYRYGGLIYLGYSNLISSITVSLILFITARHNYGFVADVRTCRIFIMTTIMLVITFVLSYTYFALTLICGIATISYSAYTLFSDTDIIKNIKNHRR